MCLFKGGGVVVSWFSQLPGQPWPWLLILWAWWCLVWGGKEADLKSWAAGWGGEGRGASINSLAMVRAKPRLEEWSKSLATPPFVQPLKPIHSFFSNCKKKLRASFTLFGPKEWLLACPEKPGYFTSYGHLERISMFQRSFKKNLCISMAIWKDTMGHSVFL